jgi:L-fuconate dehydratase
MVTLAREAARGMGVRITGIEALDLRFPTSRTLAGSDAMNPDPDYSAAYCIVRTDIDGLEGHGLTFTIGRGNDLCVAAIQAYAPLVVGLELEQIQADPAGFWRRLAGDSQLRWLGPEKGVVHLALAAVVNAVWDLWARQAGKPLWRLLSDMSPEQIVGLVDFRHMTDALDRDQALDLLRAVEPGKTKRIAQIERDGYPAYTTSAGWLGYPDEKIAALVDEAKAEGWTALKMKVGRDLDDDRRRCRLVRDRLGDSGRMMIDANQVWEVGQAIEWVRALADTDPYWIEEPISPDDILGHAAIARAVRPIRVATGEHGMNRVLFKQMLQADALDVVQLDACRLGGVNECVAVLLLAARFGKPVCPHAGGVGLCEYVQHLSMFDYIAVSGSLDGRMTEHAAHLHEHFVDPIRVRGGRYLAPTLPGYSGEILPDSRAAHLFPTGPVWR